MCVFLALLFIRVGKFLRDTVSQL